MRINIVILYILTGNILYSQDTIKVKRPSSYDNFCFLELCINDSCYTDSIPLSIFSLNNNIELRVSGPCSVKKSKDVFVSSFEINTNENNSPKFAAAQSSFMNASQKKCIQQLKVGDTFIIQNISIHGPDSFRKMDDIKIKIY